MKNYCTVSRYRYLLFVSLLVFGPSAPADVDTPSQPALGVITTGFSLLDFHYKEFDDNGKLLDREDGLIPGFIVEMSESEDNWVYAGSFTYHANDVLYDGQTNTGVPITTRTEERIFDLAMRAERWYRDRNDQNRYAWYGGFGYHNWNRNIRPTRTAAGAPVNGIIETYKWWYGLAGGKYILADAGKSQWLVDLRLTRTFRPSLHVDFQGPCTSTIQSSCDNAELNLGARFDGRLSFPWHYRLDKKGIFSIEPYLESWTLGRSPTSSLTAKGKTVGTVSEPRSETRNFGIVFTISQNY